MLVRVRDNEEDEEKEEEEGSCVDLYQLSRLLRPRVIK